MRVRESSAGDANPNERRLKLRVRICGTTDHPQILKKSFVYRNREIFTARKSYLFQTPVKLSDGVFMNQNCMYIGTEAQPNLKQFCNIRVLKYKVHNLDPINHPDKSILKVSKLQVVKTAEVRDLIPIGIFA